MNIRSLVVLYLSFFTLACGEGLFVHSVWAQSVSSKSESSSGASSSSSSQDATPTPDEMVEPLDAWVVVKPKNYSVSVASSSSASVLSKRSSSSQSAPKYLFDIDEALLKEAVDEDAAKNNKGVDQSAYQRKKALTATQKLRVRAVTARYLRSVAEVQARLNEFFSRDSRGPSELTFCSLNVNNYGLKPEIQKILRARGMKNLKKREKSFVSGISEVGCDVIAVQGIIGRNRHYAVEGLTAFAQLIAEGTGRIWRGYLGDSNHKFAYNGYLVTEAVKVVSVSSYNKLLLPRFGIFEEDQFFRAPVELDIVVTGKNGSKNKKVKIFTMHLQASLTGAAKEKIPSQMQMAEGLRQLIEARQRRFDPRDSPILIVAGDRGANHYSPVARILEGFYRLSDFRSDGGCVVSKVGKVTCAQPINRPRQLFSVIGGGVPNPPTQQVKNEEGKLQVVLAPAWEQEVKRSLNQRWAAFADIYLSVTDLPLAWAKPTSELEYASGAIQMKGARLETPLVWVKLNW